MVSVRACRALTETNPKNRPKKLLLLLSCAIIIKKHLGEHIIPKLVHKMGVNMRKVHMRKHLILQVVMKTGENVRMVHLGEHLFLKVGEKTGDHMSGYSVWRPAEYPY